MKSLFQSLRDHSLGFVADLRDFVLLHFTVAPENLANHVPYALDVHGGCAYVSLVAFQLRGLRPARLRPPALGRWLLRPISDHRFLNVRTYVRGPAGPGIHFFAEWINNPLSRRLGPLTHGLPCRFARMEAHDLRGGGLRRLLIEDPNLNAHAALITPLQPDGKRRAARSNATDSFLFERYRAYTHRHDTGRYFDVRHAPWEVAPFTLARFDTTLFERVFPWFGDATFVGGHVAEGFNDVFVSGAKRIRQTETETIAASAPSLAPEPFKG